MPVNPAANESCSKSGLPNEAAIRLYRKLGFEILGTAPGYYEDNGEDAYIFVKKGWGGSLKFCYNNVRCKRPHNKTTLQMEESVWRQVTSPESV